MGSGVGEFNFIFVFFLFYGLGTIVPMLEAVMAVVPVEKLAVHFHDTYGQSLPNILVSLQVSHNRTNLIIIDDLIWLIGLT